MPMMTNGMMIMMALTTAIMVYISLLENCMEDRVWVVFMVYGNWVMEGSWVISVALDVGP